jgi:FkbM family methyltransferase
MVCLFVSDQSGKGNEMINDFTHWLKCNRIIRSCFQTLLGKYNTSRPYKNLNATLHFLAGRHLSNFLSRFAEQEPIITENILKFIKPGSIVFDIGANIGYYTIMFSKIASQGIVISVEPDHYNLYWINKNIVMNHLTNVTLIPKAISNVESEVEFYVDKNTGRTSSLSKEVFHPAGNFGLEKTTVRTITCDSIAQKNNPDFIKCDIEGHEVAFLAGATETLKHHPIIMMEVKEENRKEVMRILHDSGYSMYNAEKSWTSTTTRLLQIESENILAIPAEYKMGEQW